MEILCKRGHTLLLISNDFLEKFGEKKVKELFGGIVCKQCKQEKSLKELKRRLKIVNSITEKAVAICSQIRGECK